ncbi:zf-TFIIB domain-containing protein [Leucobacter albus]|uniref:Zf-TFIIB domain-containing protein n=1 Tax=Leucobacter albus TaxID=272210 RepID=A0ABW3TLC5_9MICO
MNCPSDGTTLLMSERQGIEIDYCPQCRGIWLDRGELDKILERAQAEAEAFAAQQAPQHQAPQAPAAPASPAAPQAAPPLGDHYSQPVPPQPYGYDDRGRDDRGYGERSYGDRGYGHDDRGKKPRYDDRRGGYGDPRYRKKKSPFEFLGDIFDS